MEIINDNMNVGDAGEDTEDETRLQIERNDPSLTKLKIDGRGGYRPVDGNWSTLGAAIGRNTHLKKISLDHIVRRDDLESLLRGLSDNLSIKKLSLSCCYLPDGELFSLLVPFFKNNHSFESLEMFGCILSQPSSIVSLTMALQQFNSLREFLFSCNQYDYHVHTTKIIHALSHHSDLKKLRLDRLTKNGYIALAALLKNSRLAVLDLLQNHLLYDEGAAILARGLDGGTLEELNLGRNFGVKESGWMAIFTALGNTGCILKKLSLRANEINDAALQCLLNTLSINNTLKSLDLSCPYVFRSIASWRSFFEYLRFPKCVIKELDLSHCNFNDEVAISLSNALANNRNLRKLNLTNNEDVTPEGWQTFSPVLQSPNSALESLTLIGNRIDDDTLISLANSLVNNIKLKELIIGRWLGTNITSRGWTACSQLLCNTTSINDTYDSNHTLARLCLDPEEDRLPEDLKSLLIVNRENTKSQAARLKIIKVHLHEGLVIQPFIEMELNVLPLAISWMGRGGKSNATNNRFYAFLRSMPTLFEGGGVSQVQGK